MNIDKVFQPHMYKSENGIWKWHHVSDDPSILQAEMWLMHPKFPNHRFSPDGKVLSLVGKPRVRTLTKNRGYVRLEFKGKHYLIHRIIAEIFIPNPNNLPQVNHKNAIKTDNRIENLEWVTAKQNCEHRKAMGLENPPIGERSGMAKLTDNKVKKIKTLLEQGITQQKIADMFSVTRECISSIEQGRTWKHIE